MPNSSPVSLVIIGGGASGMAAAIAARETADSLGLKRGDFSIVIVERNCRLGEKIRISGGGKCNITHEGTPADLLRQGFFTKAEERFLRSALFSFTNSDTLELLARKGLETRAREDGKVFPVDGNGPAVAEAFGSLLDDFAVRVQFSSRVKKVFHRDGQFELLFDTHGTLCSKHLVLATGGVSWPQTGTTGDGLRIARSLGHTLAASSPALAPLYLVRPPSPALAGISLRSVGLRVSSVSGEASRRGDVLFTHKGLSGPAALSLSRDAALLLSHEGKCSVVADLFPDLPVTALEGELLRQAKEKGAQMIRKFLQMCPIAPPGRFVDAAPHGTIPSALVPFIMKHSGIEADVAWSSLSKIGRKSLLRVLKNFPLGEVGRVPLEQGEVSAGGVVLREINPKTMESRVVPGLYLCGEILDYAGEIGGFNLQAAFSTGWLAGSSAVSQLQE
ncbi:aminoacetone oxidase family FAD-binding enzyme [Chlorobium phaeovibrioides]|uniref:NAD(P)/FAD-dependent oxidoreductase n=1 Tax=Chlorobium phaeovibrioides TaxID=1094 RepID=UPI000F817199|nr:aminoacetone oxidase family FAD-binding enzyme [Chlorobium phaeovibrioides]QEQ57054.1 aminoacetone oxidase family FAD-binding enzyme [Chlorobium phaeovibrioides]RTY35023.1 aminoacetone oxidase family FAD-binding enzyme [Chlorobium phaeovibrioides]